MQHPLYFTNSTSFPHSLGVLQNVQPRCIVLNIHTHWSSLQWIRAARLFALSEGVWAYFVHDESLWPLKHLLSSVFLVRMEYGNHCSWCLDLIPGVWKTQSIFRLWWLCGDGVKLVGERGRWSVTIKNNHQVYIQQPSEGIPKQCDGITTDFGYIGRSLFIYSFEWFQFSHSSTQLDVLDAARHSLHPAVEEMFCCKPFTTFFPFSTLVAVSEDNDPSQNACYDLVLAAITSLPEIN